MILKTVTLGAIENNNYLLFDETTKDAVLFDCTEASEEIESLIDDLGLNLKYILITHGHFDHILGINHFKEKYPSCQVMAPQEDKQLIEKIKDFAKKFGVEKVEVQKIDKYLNDGDIIPFVGEEIKVIHTPGHTKGGVCYLLDDKIFTGDTLFFESVGRTDLPGGNFVEIKSSIQDKLFTLDAQINVYPGHGPSTKIGHEKVNNNFV